MAEVGKVAQRQDRLPHIFCNPACCVVVRSQLSNTNAAPVPGRSMFLVGAPPPTRNLHSSGSIRLSPCMIWVQIRKLKSGLCRSKTDRQTASYRLRVKWAFRFSNRVVNTSDAIAFSIDRRNKLTNH